MPNPSALATLERLYTFDPAAIGDFLTAHPFLVPLLEEAYAHMREYFPDSELRLELSHPFDDALRLWLLICTNETDARQQLDAVDTAWWIGNKTRAQRLLSIDIEWQ